eukprot:TRINITY_DN6487_c0_g2_i3.p1 TRINITY_DN6487_c0_g2~~TRINITY_DN6487_c0_g2_i3.p1  ORF type:complete len:212 (+),score=48.91 TRINITY_DN6487_c0_g2_i3:104-739(+)
MMSTQTNSLQFKTTKLSIKISKRFSQLVKLQKQPKVIKLIRSQAAEENGSEFVSGEWPVNWSLVSMEDCNSYYIDKKLKTELEPHYKLEDIMDKDIFTAQENQAVSELKKSVGDFGCVPVTSGMGVLLGVIYEADLKKSGTGSIASSIMSNPIAGKSDYSVEQAACIMLKYKISSLPVVDESAVLIGMVDSNEIFQAMEIEAGIEAKVADI